MPVQFIVGRAGSGKSRYCFEQIVELTRRDPLGPPIYLVVPKQETFSAERRLTCNSGLPGFCRIHVVSFELMGEQILASCGGTAIPQIDAMGRQMIIGHLLRKHESELNYFRSAARRVGLPAALDSTFDEFERAGQGSAELANLLTTVSSDAKNPSLVQKLTDLQLLYDRYLAYLGSERLDPHRRLEQVLNSIDQCEPLRHATIFVDDFLDFHDWQRRMLQNLSRIARDIKITLLMDPASPMLADPHQNPEELGLFFKTEETYRRLWFTFSQAGEVPIEPIRLRKTSRFQSAELSQIEQHLFARRPAQSHIADAVELTEAADRRAEVDACARRIRQLAREGIRYRDQAVLVRNLEDYYELISASFSEHDIPFFADRRRTAAHHPLLQFTRNLLQICVADWPRDAVMSLLKTELAGLSQPQIDLLENYVIEHRIRGGQAWMNPAAWSYHRDLTLNENASPPLSEHADLEQIDQLRRMLADWISPLFERFYAHKQSPARSLAIELIDTFERCSIRQKLQQWIAQANQANQLEEAAEHVRVWAALCELLDQMVNVIGDQEMTPEDFVLVLEAGLERFDLALTPPTLDQVLVGSVDRTRNLQPRVAHVLGLNDGEFPRLPSEDSILSDTERQSLRKHQWNLESDSQQKLLEERLLGYIALTRASERLCLFRAAADSESRPQAPSPFWLAIQKQFPRLLVNRVERNSTSLDVVGTPRQLVTSLMRWVRSPDNSQTAFASIYQWLTSHDDGKDKLTRMRDRAWPALLYRNDAQLSDEVAAALFKSPLRASVTQIETFAACPFKHFARFGLRLSQRDEEDVTAIDLGIACHTILERIVRQMIQEKQSWATQSSEETARLVKIISDDVAVALRGEMLMSSGRNRYLLDYIQRTIQRVLQSQAAAGKRSKFVPFATELPFGDGKTLDPLILQTPAGHELRLQGKIDRVDFLQDQTAFAVIDYKYRGDKLDLIDVLHGLSLQLLTYLLVLQANGSKLADKKLTPAAALYIKLLQTLESTKYPESNEPQSPLDAHKLAKPRGLIDRQFADAFDSERDPEKTGLGELFNKNDGVSTEQFASLLLLAQRKLAELGDLILSGTIKVDPYRIRQHTPCTHCDFQSVCRLDLTVNSYRWLKDMKPKEILAELENPSK